MKLSDSFEIIYYKINDHINLNNSPLLNRFNWQGHYIYVLNNWKTFLHLSDIPLSIFLPGKTHCAIEDDGNLTPRRIKLQNTDASKARIRSIRSFVENKYTVYKKSKESHDSKGSIGLFYRRDYQKVCPGAILEETGRR